MSEPSVRQQNRKPNRLVHETSPYLLQHAYNPVDWRPWGTEAFEEARRRDVPILLSVGYSTCYWCHVMERESFEHDEVARAMNERFVCIKLDREERPDVDDLYMTALVMMTGHGGWPMNVFLDPQTLAPFWCGTYFPPEPRMNMPAWSQVLERLSDAWVRQREEVVAQAAHVAQAVREHLSPSGEELKPTSVRGITLGQTQVTAALSHLLKTFDRNDGGFGSAPKFPQPVLLEFLLSVRPLASDDATGDAIDEALNRTLSRMACGGIFDQVGGGFHRYSVDARWTVPHFEKMLYDNAQLLRTYARASAYFGDRFYASIAERVGEYALAEMSGPDGGFFSAQDAEVDGREGKNYLWTPAQLREALSADDSAFIERVYGVDQGPNFQDPHHPGEPPTNVLRMADRPDRLSRSMSVSEADLIERVGKINRTLLSVRALRPQPGLDDKVIAGWNGLMLGAFALAGRVIERPDFVAAAERAATFLRARMWDGSTLSRAWCAGRLGARGTLEDYACTIAGVVDLVEALRDDPHSSSRCAEWTAWAEQLADAAHHKFSDGLGRYFDTPAGEADLFARSASASDGALPSGLSVMLNALLDLARITGNAKYLGRASDLLNGMSRAISDSPVGAINAVRALVRVLTQTEFDSIARMLGGQEGPSEPSGERADSGPESFSPVEVYAGVERVAVGEDRPALVRLVMRIAEGYHVVAAEPLAEIGRGVKTPLAPFRAGIVGGSGVRAYADYPSGEPLELNPSTADVPSSSDPIGALRVYTGSVEFDVALERDGAWSGRPLLAITYQACSDSACLSVRTVELDVPIDPG